MFRAAFEQLLKRFELVDSMTTLAFKIFSILAFIHWSISMIRPSCCDVTAVSSSGVKTSRGRTWCYWWTVWGWPLLEESLILHTPFSMIYISTRHLSIFGSDITFFYTHSIFIPDQPHLSETLDSLAPSSRSPLSSPLTILLQSARRKEA